MLSAFRNIQYDSSAGSRHACTVFGQSLSNLIKTTVILSSSSGVLYRADKTDEHFVSQLVSKLTRDGLHRNGLEHINSIMNSAHYLGL